MMAILILITFPGHQITLLKLAHISRFSKAVGTLPKWKGQLERVKKKVMKKLNSNEEYINNKICLIFVYLSSFTIIMH